QLLVQLQKNFLGYIFRQRPVLQVMPTDAEDHGLMLSDDLGKCRRIAADRPRQCRLQLLSPVSVQSVPFYRINTLIGAKRMQEKSPGIAGIATESRGIGSRL